jgi:hypothetical protein
MTFEAFATAAINTGSKRKNPSINDAVATSDHVISGAAGANSYQDSLLDAILSLRQQSADYFCFSHLRFFLVTSTPFFQHRSCSSGQIQPASRPHFSTELMASFETVQHTTMRRFAYLTPT